MITSAACRAAINSNEVVTIRCHRHCDFFETMKLLHIDYDKNNVEQGFIDWNEEKRIERFVSREEAYQIALREGQLSGLTDTPGQLFSEDIY